MNGWMDMNFFAWVSRNRILTNPEGAQALNMDMKLYVYNWEIKQDSHLE